MVDNVAITPGSGATIATDDVGGVQYQRVKLDLGGDGSSSPLLRGQQTKSNSLPVALASDHDALPVTDNGAALSVDDGGGSLTVDGTVTLGAGSASIGALGANSGIDIGDVTVNNGIGAAAVNIQDGGNSITVDGSVAVTGSVTAANTAGDAAHDGADSGNPVKIGARARATDIAAVASDDRTDLIADLTGKLIVNPYAIPESSLHGATAAITGTTDTAVIAAQGIGARIYVTELLVTNSHATVGTVVEIKDGATVIHRGFAAPNGGGFALTFPKPLRLTANTALNAANATTGSNTYVSASGYKAP